MLNRYSLDRQTQVSLSPTRATELDVAGVRRPGSPVLPASEPALGGSPSGVQSTTHIDNMPAKVHRDPPISAHLPQAMADSRVAGQRLVQSLSVPPLDELDQRRSVRKNGGVLNMQQRLRQVERNLRNSLNPSLIAGTTVVESAALLAAEQVSLLQYRFETQRWLPEAQYCLNQSRAWKPRISLLQAEYPDLMQQLISGKTVVLSADQPTVTSESRQWLAYWPGSWLLVPIQNSQATHSSINHASSKDVVQSGRPVRAVALPAAGQLGWADNAQMIADAAHHWGVLALARPEAQSWDAEAIASVESIATEFSLAMAKAEQYQSLLIANQELQKLALSDGLTRLANRRRFDEHLADEWHRLARDRQPLSLILCDLDHFKLYNDTFGHPAGDRCLIMIARALLSGPQRPADLVARYGGEEFAIILPNTDTNGAWRMAQKLHANIRDLKIAHAADNDKPFVTVTMGVSTIVPGHETTSQVLVQAADLALYHAKQQGRDRTYVHAHYNTVNSEGNPEGTDSSAPSEASQPVAMTPED